MSYYYRNPYKFSYHGVGRIRTRLNLQGYDEIQVRAYCLQLINEAHEIEETVSFKYVKVNKTNLYFIIRKDTNLILTLSPMSASKLLAVINENL